MVSVICSAPKDLIAVFLWWWQVVGMRGWKGSCLFSFPSTSHYLMRIFGVLISATSCEFELVVVEGPDAGFAAPEILAARAVRRPWVFVGVRERR